MLVTRAMVKITVMAMIMLMMLVEGRLRIPDRCQIEIQFGYVARYRYWSWRVEGRQFRYFVLLFGGRVGMWRGGVVGDGRMPL